MIPIWGATGGAMALAHGVTFAADLRHSLIARIAYGNGSPTYTNTTDNRTFRDHEGVLRTVPAGCARFEGAWFVRNLIPTTSENFDNAAWDKQAGGGGSAPVVTADQEANPISGVSCAYADKVVFAAPVSGDISFLNSPSATTIAGNTILGSCYVKAFAAGDIGKQLLVRHGGAANYTTITLTSSYQRISNNEVAALTSTQYQIGLRPQFGGSTGTVSIYLAAAMLEDVTGRADQTTPSEYVSVGALDYRSEQDPLYYTQPVTNSHYVSTPSASANQITGSKTLLLRDLLLASIAPAAFGALLDATDAASANGYGLFQDIAASGKLVYFHRTGGLFRSAYSTATLASVGITTTTKCSLAVTHNTTTGIVKFWYKLGVIGAAWTQLGVDVGSTAGTTEGLTSALCVFNRAATPAVGLVGGGNVGRAMLYSGVVTDLDAGTGGTLAQELYPHRDATTPTGTITSSTTGEVWTINGASSVVRSAAYHGAGVDGVKFFDTDLDGNPLPTAYTYDAVSLNGVAGTYVSTPDSVAASITGDIDIRVKAMLTDWTPSSEQCLVGKLNAPNSAYSFSVFTGGALRFRTSSDGTTYDIQTDSTVAPTVSDGAALWVRVTRNRAGGEVTFYTSSDGTTWTQLGTTKTGESTTAAKDSTAALEVGSFFAGANSVAGKIYQAQIYNGINGTLAVDFDASRYAGGTTLTGSTGETWTLQGNAVIHPTNYPNTGYVAEGARTNLCLQSNAFTTTWTNNSSTAPAQNLTGPDGGTTGWYLDDLDGSNRSVQQANITLTAATYTASVFIKKTSGATSFPVVHMYVPAGSVEMQACTVDTNNGIATDWTAYTGFTMASGRSVSISSYDANWWRVSLTKTGTAAANTLQINFAATTNATQSSGSLSAAVTGSIGLYGAQVELGSFASSYIATTTAAVARNADVLTYQVSGNVANAEGWAYAEVSAEQSGAATAQKWVVYGATAAGNGGPLFTNSSSKVSLADDTAQRPSSLIYTGPTMAKIASSWGGASTKAAQNGSVDSSLSFSGTLGLTTNFAIGNGFFSGFEWFGTIRNVRLGQRQLSASEMQAVTAA